MVSFKKMMVISFAVLCMGMGGQGTLAAEIEGFTVKPVVNDQTVTKNASWFNFSVDGKAGETIENQYTLINRSNEPKTIKITGYNGYSQPQGGGLSYNTGIEDGGIIDKGYEFIPLLDSAENEVTLAPNESKNVSFSIVAPEITGQLLGGLSFSEIGGKVESEDPAEENEGGLSVEITKEYVVAVQMFGKEGSATADYISTDARADVLGQLTNVFWKMENPNDMISTHDVNYELTKSGEMVQEGVIEEFKMAPKTYTEARFAFSGQLASGDYILNINGTEMPFTISDELVERAKEKAPEDANITTQGFTTLQVILIAIGAAVLILLIAAAIFFMWWKRYKKKEEEKKKAEANKNDTESNRVKTDDL